MNTKRIAVAGALGVLVLPVVCLVVLMGAILSPPAAAASVASPAAYSDTATTTTAATGAVAYVTLNYDNLIALVDTAGHSVVGTVDVGAAGCDYPWRATMTPSGAHVYVACYASGSVAVIETAGNTVVTNVSGIPYAAGIAFTRDGAYALVGSLYAGQIAVIDTATYFWSFLSTPGNPISIAAHPLLDRAYATCSDGTILVIDTTTFDIINTIFVGGGPSDVATSPDGRWVFAADSWGAGLTVIDVTSDTVYTTITGLGELRDLDVAPDGSRIYACNPYNSVRVIDTSAFSPIATVAVPGSLVEAAVTCDGGEVYVGNNSSQVPVVNAASLAVTYQIPVPGYSSQGIAICPQRVASGLHLNPDSQTHSGARGETVSHDVRLFNLTGASDSFNLTLGSSAWDATLSTTSIGPIEDGESVSFSVYVTVPTGVDWYSTDTVVVTATSVISPAFYSDTAAFSTQAFAPPEIDIAPGVVTSTQFVGEVVARTLTIGNGNGVTLTYSLAPSAVTGAALLYHFDEPAGASTFHDDSGNGNHGSCSGTACPTAGVEGRFGQALSFDGANDYIQVGAPVPPALQIENEISLEAWIYITGYPDPYDLRTIVGCQSDASTSGYAIHVDGRTNPDGHPAPAGHIHFQIGDGQWHTTNVNAAVPLNQWVHIVAVRKANEDALVYYNGVQQPSTSEPWSGSITYWAPALEVGRQLEWHGRYFDGLIDEVAIYDRALSAQEVEVRYHYGPGGGDVPWLSPEPISGTVFTESAVPIQLTLDAAAMQPDTYATHLAIQSNDPVRPSVGIPVTMTVLPTANMGWVEGTVSDAGTGDPLESTVLGLGQPYTVTTDPATGHYILWLDAGNYTLQVSAADYVTATAAVGIVAQQGTTRDFALASNVPVIEVSPDSLAVTQEVGNVATEWMTITNAGPAPLDFEIGSGSGVLYFATSTELYGYDVPEARLRVIGTQDDTHVRVIDLSTGAVIDENADLDRYSLWDVYPGTGTFFKVEADKPVVAYESNFAMWSHTTFAPSLDSGPVGKEFIFYYHGAYYGAEDLYVFAIDPATVNIYDTTGTVVGSRTMVAGEYWDVSLSNAVYHVVSTGNIAVETASGNSYSTIPSTTGAAVGRRFYFGTNGDFTGAFAVLAYIDTDVEVYDLDSGSLLYSQHINQGDYFWQTGVGTRRLRLESTGDVEVWAGDREGCCGIEYLGDDISFAGGVNGQEYWVHSLMEGSVLFAPFDNTTVNVDGTVYHLSKDEYLHLPGCCHLRRIQSNRPVLIQTLGADSGWNAMGTYLGGVIQGVGGLSWLTTEPTTGTVPAFTSMLIQVTFDATGMQPGDHTTDIVIGSNDPVRPSVSVPVTMTVLPTADMGRVVGTVSDAWTGDPLEATVELVGVYSTTARPDFSIWAPADTYSLRAYASGYYTVTVSVTIVAGGTTTENLALEPALPRLAWAPDAVAAVTVEGTRLTQTLVVSNTGPLPLDIALHEISPALVLRAPIPDDMAGKRILYDRAHGEPGTWEYSTLASDIVDAGAEVIENWYYPIDASVLEGYDVLWVNCCGGTAWGFSELEAVNDWLAEGGAVFVQGESSASTDGLASIYGIGYQWGACTSGTTTNIAGHPISEGVDAVNVEWTCWRLAPGAGADIVVLDPQSQPHVVAQEQGSGKMVVVASEDFVDWHISNDDNRLLANNIVAWLARPGYSDVPWLSATPEAARIPGHSSLAVSLAFDARALSVGNYEAFLAMEHNDPAQAFPVELPITLAVVGRQAGLSLLPSLQEGSGLPGATVVYTLTVTNLGNDTDTFSLDASGAWEATLSAVTTGPLGVGESLVFTIDVSIPAVANPGSSDTTSITARSAADPTVSESAETVTTAASAGRRTIYLPLIRRNSE